MTLNADEAAVSFIVVFFLLHSLFDSVLIADGCDGIPNPTYAEVQLYLH
jgi:hypothetical protein